LTHIGSSASWGSVGGVGSLSCRLCYGAGPRNGSLRFSLGFGFFGLEFRFLSFHFRSDLSLSFRLGGGCRVGCGCSVSSLFLLHLRRAREGSSIVGSSE
jgi:hypothetical protein